MRKTNKGDEHKKEKTKKFLQGSLGCNNCKIAVCNVKGMESVNLKESSFFFG